MREYELSLARKPILGTQLRKHALFRPLDSPYPTAVSWPADAPIPPPDSSPAQPPQTALPSTCTNATDTKPSSVVHREDAAGKEGGTKEPACPLRLSCPRADHAKRAAKPLQALALLCLLGSRQVYSPDVHLTHGHIALLPRAFSGVSPLVTAARVLACALTLPLRHAATKHWLQSKDLQTLFTIDDEGVFVLDTGATTFILTVPTLTVPDRFSLESKTVKHVKQREDKRLSRLESQQVRPFLHDASRHALAGMGD